MKTIKKEMQAIEFKQSWRDEYLDWICGYANAYGGTLYIGRADDGAPVGVAKAKALISYEGITRVERFMFSRDAFREIVVHKDYSSNNPIQISVYPDKIYVWNNGTMPRNLDSAEKLFDKHSSEPFNPNLAQVFFKSGLIEAWGRGFDKIRAGCEEYGGELPAYEISENGIMVLCKACPSYLAMLGNGADLVHGSEVKSKGESKGKSKVKSKGKNEDRIIALLASNPYLRQSEIAAKVGLSLPGVEKIMRRLRSEGKLVREGSSRNGCWKVVLE